MTTANRSVQTVDTTGAPTNKKPTFIYILLALFVVCTFGGTFVSLKIVSAYFTPPQVMLVRCIIAYISLLIIYPKFHKPESLKQELVYLFAGLFGTTLYITFVNTAFDHTQVSNASVLSSTSPIFIALLTPLFLRGASIKKMVYVGFAFATIGTILVATRGDFNIKLSFLGDAIALLSAISWALYSLILRKNTTSYPQFYATRRIFLYGIICVIPICLVQGKPLHVENLAIPMVLAHMLFLGIVAYTCCHVSWGVVCKNLGPVKAGNFMYLTPVVTIILSAIILSESINGWMVLGTVLILLGVSISDGFITRIINGRSNQQPELAQAQE